jgi:diketogulonate reductase-like aldo/keto reductase
MKSIDRRQFLSAGASAAVASAFPSLSFSQKAMRRRKIPSSGEEIPVCGLGSSPIFMSTPEGSEDVTTSVIRAMFDMGGRMIDTPSFLRNIDPVLGQALKGMGLLEESFISAKITVRGKEAGGRHLERLQAALGKNPLDLLMIHNMMDLSSHWPTLKEWKDSGRARYIGVTQTERVADDALIKLMESGELDMLQVNYSIQQPQAADRIFPAAIDNGVAIITIQPFSNGRYFSVVSGRELPDWTAEFDCESWAQFALKYILSHPAVTCALPETSKPHHVVDNMGSGYGKLPGADMRQRMFDYLWGL